MTADVIEPGIIEPPAGELPVLRLPERALFGARSQRLSSLAVNHSLGDYLLFLAGIAEAQHRALALVRDVPLPSVEYLSRCLEHGLPPLGIQGWNRAPVWREVLRQLAGAVESQSLPDATRAVARRLGQATDEALERLAGPLLCGDYQQIDRACAPFVAAALQVYWLHMASCLAPRNIAPPATPSLCPVCGSAPVASVVRIGGAEQGLRYLNCSLCETQWHEVRIKCVYCQSTEGISYYGIEGGSGAIKAECCDACQSYLKILYMEKDPLVEAVADDVGSIALDVLMADHGIDRSGVNFFLLGGSS